MISMAFSNNFLLNDIKGNTTCHYRKYQPVTDILLSRAQRPCLVEINVRISQLNYGQSVLPQSSPNNNQSCISQVASPFRSHSHFRLYSSAPISAVAVPSLSPSIILGSPSKSGSGSSAASFVPESMQGESG